MAGGALDVPGNVSVEGFDGSAEWNFFWDPSAAKRVRETIRIHAVAVVLLALLS